MTRILSQYSYSESVTVAGLRLPFRPDGIRRRAGRAPFTARLRSTGPPVMIVAASDSDNASED